MADAKPFLSQTAQTASFAFREYFRPLVLVARFSKSRLTSAKPAEPAAERGKVSEQEKVKQEKVEQEKVSGTDFRGGKDGIGS